jgi:hypothetical protein
MFDKSSGLKVLAAAIVMGLANAAFAGTPIDELRQTVGVPLEVVFKGVKPTPQRDEWNQPDLRGEFDAMIPVDEAYPLPEVPSRLHDVATIRNGRFVRPHIPVSRTSNDGRIGIAQESQSSNVLFFLYTPEKLHAKGVHYTQAQDGSADLMSPKVMHVNFADLVNAEETGLYPSMYAVCDTSYAQLDNEIYGSNEETLHRSPYPVSEDMEAYDLTIWSSDIDKGNDLSTDVDLDKKTLMFTFNVRIFVKNPKTPDAELVGVERVGEPIIVEAPSRPLTLFEPTITGDGRLLVTRTSGTGGSGGGVDSIEPRAWVDANGVTQHTLHDIVYAYNSPDSGFAPCDPRAWTNLKPLSYAHHDPEVRERYGFAKFPLRDFEGVEIAPGQETGIMYPWVDRKGANIMFTSTRRLKVSDELTYATPEDVELLETLNGDETYDASGREQMLYEAGLQAVAPEQRPHLMMPAAHQIPLPLANSNCEEGVLCQETTAREHVSPTRQIGIVGLWTQGKMVQIDGIVNATDLGYRVLDEGHKLIRLYHGQGGVVRVGNGRTNTGQPEWADFDTYRPHNDSVMESLENKFFFTDTMKPAAPYDVVWAVSTGRGTSELVFDDYMDNDALILSEMVASVSTTFGPIAWNRPNTGDRLGWPLRVQNSSTRVGSLNAPYGDVFGDTKNGTRIEPVALGGLYGKGLWLSKGAGVRYSFPVTGLAEAQSKTAAYYGLALDPRVDLSKATEHRLITTPTGSIALQTGDTPSLVFRAPLGVADLKMPLPQIQESQWIHLGIEVDGRELTVYVDGFRYFAKQLDGLGADFMQVSIGDTIVGSPDPLTKGIHGWIDQFKLFSRPVLNPEEACNRSMGSLVRLPAGAGNGGYPDESHELIAVALGESASTRYECKRNYASEGFSFLATVPKKDRVGLKLRNIKPLKYDEPRPDEADNAFCLVCHTQGEHPSETMTVDALLLKNTPMQLDKRRQPLQPYPAAIGHIPHNWLAQNESDVSQRSGSFHAAGEWVWVDELLLSENKDGPAAGSPPVNNPVERSGGGTVGCWFLICLVATLVCRRRLWRGNYRRAG